MGCGNTSCTSSQCYVHANERMHDGMALSFECDTATDFVRGMIPHHQGAIDMCNVLVETAAAPDAALVTLCSGLDSPNDYLKGILNTQAREITQMRAWLGARGVGEGTVCSSMSSMERRRLMEVGGGEEDAVNEDGLTALEVSCGITERLSEQNTGGLIGPEQWISESGGFLSRVPAGTIFLSLQRSPRIYSYP